MSIAAKADTLAEMKANARNRAQKKRFTVRSPQHKWLRFSTSSYANVNYISAAQHR
jgi:hypothetical protein